jgi:hypothetical protein
MRRKVDLSWVTLNATWGWKRSEGVGLLVGVGVGVEFGADQSRLSRD